MPAGESHLVEVDVIHAHETDDPQVPGANDFLLMTLQFDCARKQSRIAGGYALMFDARVDRAPGASPWTGGYEKNWQGLVARVACDPDARPDPKAMVWLGGFYRPVDVVDIVRRYLWKQSP